MMHLKTFTRRRLIMFLLRVKKQLIIYLKKHQRKKLFRKELSGQKYNLRSRERPIDEANLTEIIEPDTYDEAITCKEKDKWQEAINDELESHRVSNTWELVKQPADKKLVGSKWVFQVKQNADNTIRYKASII